MWTEEQRARHAPRGRRYPSDLTDAELALIAPFIPPPRSGGRLTVEIVKRNDGQKGFAVLPRRWVVRAHAGLAHPLPTARAALRSPRRDCRRLHQARHDPHHAAPPRKPFDNSINFRVWLLVSDCVVCDCVGP